MKKYVVFLFIALIAITTVVYVHASPDAKKAIRDALRNGPFEVTKYVIGQGSKPMSIPDAQEKAQKEAVVDVYNQIAKTMQNIILASLDKPGYSNVAEYYNSVAQKPNVFVELPGLKYVLPGYEDKNNYVHAVVALDRKESKADSSDKADELRKTIVDELDGIPIGSSPEEEVKINLKAYNAYEALKEQELIMLGSGYKPDQEDTFKELRKFSTDMMPEHRQEDINDVINEYYEENYNVSSLADIAKIIADQFDMQEANTSGKLVQLDMFTYGMTDTTTTFSTSLQNALDTELSTKWSIVSGTGSGAMGLQPAAKLRLTGTFWEIGAQNVTIRAALREVEKGAFEAAAIFTFKKKQLGGIIVSAYTPPDLRDIEARLAADALAALENGRKSSSTTPPPSVTGKTPTTPSADAEYTLPLQVRVRTSKGENSQTVMVGEKLYIYVQTNQPAHLRLISVLPGNKWTLLAKDMFIDSDNTNTWVTVPGNFVVAPPIGNEEYRVMAREMKEGPFPKITEFYNEGGYRYIGQKLLPSATQQEMLAHAKGQMRASKGTQNLDISTSPDREDKGTTNTDLTRTTNNTGGASQQAAAAAAADFAVVTATLNIRTIGEE